MTQNIRLRRWLRARRLRRGGVGGCALIATLLSLAGCGGGGQVDTPPIPRRVPSGAVAVVGATPITAASLEHWLPILYREQAATESTTTRALPHRPAYTGCIAVLRARGERASESALRAQCAQEYRTAVEETMSFLLRAQWLLQESRAEGINESVLNRLVSQRSAQAPPAAHTAMTGADIAFQARLDIITEALQSRHSKAAPVTQAQVARYYTAHRSQFANPPVRHTLMVVTHSLTRALEARAALATGQRWSAVARRYSVDSSALIGGAFAVVGGEQFPALERAVFNAKRGRIVGPVKAGAPIASYYLFEVTGADPGSPQSLAEVAAQIKQTLTQQLQQRSWAAFSSAYERRWTARTLCASGYLASECRNAAAATRAREP